MPSQRINAGGYEDGYRAVPCLWGRKPGSLVRLAISQGLVASGGRALDLGCGEGKNAAAVARLGYQVDAVELSPTAIANGRAAFPSAQINWINADALTFESAPSAYDLVISYGLSHCLSGKEECGFVILKAQRATKPKGTNIFCSFNSGSHDFTAHPGFTPTLLAHDYYVSLYNSWDIIYEDNSILYESHPHNHIPHHHSLTRIIARKP